MDVCSPQIIAIDLIVFLGSPLAQFGKDGGAKSDEFSERFQRHLTPTPTLRMVPISGYHVHAFHTIWPSYLLAHSRPYSLQKFYNNNFPKMREGGRRQFGISENSSDLVAPSFKTKQKKPKRSIGGWYKFSPKAQIDDKWMIDPR